MIADISIYLEGSVEDRLSKITDLKSPFILEKKYPNYCILRSQNSKLEGIFLLSTPDSEKVPLYTEAENALGFKTNSVLYYADCNLNPERIIIFRNIMDYITTNKIPCYLTARDEYGSEILIKGYNPLTNTEIQNPNFKETLSELKE